MYCSNCGTQIANDARFCPKCGTAQKGGSPIGSSAPEQWETCEIVWREIKGSFFSDPLMEYWAKAIGPDGSYYAGSSVMLDSLQPTHPDVDSHPSMNKDYYKHKTACEALLSKLLADGWMVVGQPPDAHPQMKTQWWNYKLRRRWTAEQQQATQQVILNETKKLLADLRRDGILVKLIRPDKIDTGRSKIKREAQHMIRRLKDEIVVALTNEQLLWEELQKERKRQPRNLASEATWLFMYLEEYGATPTIIPPDTIDFGKLALPPEVQAAIKELKPQLIEFLQRKKLRETRL